MTPKKPKGTTELRRRIALIIERLDSIYPDVRCALDWDNPLQLLIATVLSAQCTDERVNLTTPALFRRYPTVLELAGADPSTLEDLVRSTGFFRQKSKSILGIAARIAEDFKGEVPRTMNELITLPGVGRKTAAVVLGECFGVNEGIAVDTHVKRLAPLLGLTENLDPEKIEKDLMAIVPVQDWTRCSHLLITHGRRVCIARRPRCGECILSDICPSAAYA